MTGRPPRPEPALLAGRAALLAFAGALEGLMLANSPVLDKYAAVRLGPDGVLIAVPLLCAGVLAAVGAAAAFAPWIQATFLGLLVASMSWSLAESSQHPFWIFSNKGVWRVHAPSTGTVLAHGLAIACVGLAALGEALQSYRAAARAQKMPPGALARDTQRLATSGLALLGITTAATLPLALLLHRLADDLAGSVKGRTAFTLLVGSAVLLLVGLGLVAAQGRAKAPSPASAGAKSGDGET